MRPRSLHSSEDLNNAAEVIADGAVIGFFFNGAYALLGDLDRVDVAQRIFELKRRPPSRTLSLVCDPQHWAEFVDLASPATRRFPLSDAATLHDRLHAVGMVYPADPQTVPAHVVQDATVLNVWTRYPPLAELHESCRGMGLRALQGASANLSGEPTYTRLAEMDRVFGDHLGMVFEPDPEVPAHRRNSVSLIDLCLPTATLLREGNTTEAEVRSAIAAVGFGALNVSPGVTRL